MYAEYNRPIEFFNLLDNQKCFLRKPDDLFINYVREFFKTPERNYDWFKSFKEFVEKEYYNFVVSQTVTLDVETVPHPSEKKNVSSSTFLKVDCTDYLIKIYMYDSRFGDKYVMSGEQIISLTMSHKSLSLTVNTTFIDNEVLHSSEEELEKRSLDFIRADFEGDILYFDSEEDY